MVRIHPLFHPVLGMLLLGLSLLVEGCTGGDLPSERPADLEIRYYDGGGMNPESEEYFISADSVTRSSFYNSHHNHWLGKARASQLDSLYAQLLADDVTGIRSEDQGEVFDRGGVSVHIEFGEKRFAIVDAGNMFVEKGDHGRWQRLCQNLSAFVEAVLRPQQVKANVSLLLDSLQAAPSSCYISLDRQNILDWQGGPVDGLAGDHPLLLLPGDYDLQASAKLGERYLSLHEQVVIDAAHPDYQVVLKSDTFELQQR